MGGEPALREERKLHLEEFIRGIAAYANVSPPSEQPEMVDVQHRMREGRCRRGAQRAACRRRRQPRPD